MREVAKPAKRKPTVLGRLGGALDALTLAVSPARAKKRFIDRIKAEQFSQIYEGAQKGRFHGSWAASRGSADDDLLFNGAREEMVHRSRELAMNDPHAASMFKVLEDSVVGPGIRAQSRARPEDTGLPKEQVTEWNQACDEYFNSYAERVDGGIDATGQTDFYGLQRLVLRTFKMDGEAFLHPIMVAGELNRLATTAIELIESDRVDSPAGSSDRIREGVEIGARGQAIAYHVRKGHPGDQYTSASSEDYKRVLKYRDGRINMVHMVNRARAGQTRGVPFLAPALGWFNHLREYMRYELIAGRINASIAAFIETEGDGDEPHIEWDEDEGKYIEGISAGGIHYLGKGEKIQSFNPNRPGITFDPYVIRNLRAICAAVGLPYELVARDASSVTFVSGRWLALEAHRGFRSDQRHLICVALQPIRELVLVEGYARNVLPRIPGFAKDPKLRAALLRAVWIPPPRGFVDPTKEVAAAKEAIAIGISTGSDEAAASGRDFAENAEIRAMECQRLIELEEEHELPPGTLLPRTGAPAPAADGQSDDDRGADDQVDDGESDEATADEEVEEEVATT